MTTYQMIEDTFTTDGSGYGSFTFPNAIDKVLVCGNHPQASVGAVTAQVNGPKTCEIRVLGVSGGGLANTQVTVTLLGGNG
jgi:hypothetical protein